MATAHKLGKPPPESFPRLVAAGFLQDVRRHSTVLITDEARCYPKLAGALKVPHRSFDQSNGVFQRWDRVLGQRLSVRTGGVDQAWKAAKSFIPQSLSSRKDGRANPLLMKHLRMYQWRFERVLPKICVKRPRRLTSRERKGLLVEYVPDFLQLETFLRQTKRMEAAKKFVAGPQDRRFQSEIGAPFPGPKTCLRC